MNVYFSKTAKKVETGGLSPTKAIMMTNKLDGM